MVEIRAVHGDTNTIRFEVLDEDGAVQPITSANLIKFSVRRRGESPALIERTCTISDGPNGLCTYAWQADDWKLLRPGQLYEGRLEVTFSDGVIASTPQVFSIRIEEAFNL